MRKIPWPINALGLFCIALWATKWLAGQGLPETMVRETLIEWLAGAGCGIVVALVYAARRDDWFAAPRNAAFVALGTAVLALALIFRFVSPVAYRAEFETWSPLLGWSGFVVVVVGLLWERRRPRPVLTWVLAGLALSAVTLETAQELDRALMGESVRSWNVYHYYVGSKYFPELGYFDLYAATLYADDLWQERKRNAPREETWEYSRVLDFRQITRTRDLRKNVQVSRKAATAAFDPSVISPARLDELGRDTRFLRRFLGPDSWQKVFWDHGYNPTPVWTIVGTPLANLIPTDHWSFRLITNSDLPLYAGIAILLWWAFGLRYASIGVLWMFAVHFDHLRVTGGFLQYDWLFASVLAVCAWKKRRFALAGVALSWAAMTRVFPGFMAAPVALAMGRDLWRHRGPWIRRTERGHVRFMTGLVLGSALLFALSFVSAERLDAWPDWVHKIADHSETHPLSYLRVGVGRLALHRPVEGNFWAAYKGTDPGPLEESLPRRHWIQLACLPLLLAALWKRRVLDGMILMLFGVFLAVTLSRYYASIWILLPLAGAGVERHRFSLPGAWSAACLCALAGVFFLPGDVSGSYVLANYVALVMFVGLCLVWLWSDATTAHHSA